MKKNIIIFVFIIPIVTMGQVECRKIDEGYFFKDTCDLIGIAETEHFFRLLFEIKFPKSLQKYAVAGETYGFFCNGKQDILMYYYFRDYNNIRIMNLDTMYVPTISELNNILFREYRFENKYYDRDVQIIKGRQHLIIQKQGVTFILLNIKSKNMEMFKQYIQTFHVLRPYRIEIN